MFLRPPYANPGDKPLLSVYTRMQVGKYRVETRNESLGDWEVTPEHVASSSAIRRAAYISWDGAKI